MALQRWRYATTLLRRLGDGDEDEDDTPEGAAAILHGELASDVLGASVRFI